MTIVEINMFVDVSGVQIMFLFFLTRDMQVLVSSHFIQLLHHTVSSTEFVFQLLRISVDTNPSVSHCDPDCV